MVIPTCSLASWVPCRFITATLSSPSDLLIADVWFSFFSPNYLVYVNTLLFYRVGGTTRVAGFLLALATFLLLVIGTGPIGYIRKSFSSILF